MAPGEREKSFVDLLEVIIFHAGGIDELASATEVTAATLGRWRRGRYPTQRVRREVWLVNNWAKQNIENYPPEGFPATGLPGFIENREKKSEVDSPDETPEQGHADDRAIRTATWRRHPVLLAGGAVLIVVSSILAAIFRSSVLDPSPVVGRTVTVQNKIATGPTDLLEDKTPSYLSTQPRARCANRGCKIEGTDLYSDAALTATCRTQGDVVTNADKTSLGVTTNPGAVTSNVWLYAVNPARESGYIAVAYLVSGARSADGLPAC